MLFFTIYLLVGICQPQQQIKSLEDDSAKNIFSLSTVDFNFHFSNSTFPIVHLCCMESLLKALMKKLSLKTSINTEYYLQLLCHMTII